MCRIHQPVDRRALCAGDSRGRRTNARAPAGTLTLEPGEACPVAGPGARDRIHAGRDRPCRTTSCSTIAAACSRSYSDFDRAQGYEGEEERLRALAATMSVDPLVAIQKAAAHRYEAPVRTGT